MRALLAVVVAWRNKHESTSEPSPCIETRSVRRRRGALWQLLRMHAELRQVSGRRQTECFRCERGPLAVPTCSNEAAGRGGYGWLAGRQLALALALKGWQPSLPRACEREATGSRPSGALALARALALGQGNWGTGALEAARACGERAAVRWLACAGARWDGD